VNPTEIDDVLRTDQRIEPSAEFRAQVMCAVHAHAAVGRPRHRMERAVWPAVAVTSVVVALLIAVTLLQRSEAPPREMMEAVRWLSFTLTGTVAIAWRSIRRSV
jgi:hypothetical protein